MRSNGCEIFSKGFVAFTTKAASALTKVVVFQKRGFDISLLYMKKQFFDYNKNKRKRRIIVKLLAACACLPADGAPFLSSCHLDPHASYTYSQLLLVCYHHSLSLSRY